MRQEEDLTQRLFALFARYQYPLNDEKVLQNLIARSMEENKIRYEREYIIDPFGVVDFFIEGMAIEVKIKGQKKAIYRQCRDYCLHPKVKGLILLTNITMGLPETLNNKPVFVCSLGLAHL